MLQVPNLPNYMVQQQTSYLPMPQMQQPNYNAVKIDIHNPSVGNATCPIQQPQYAPVTAPYYAYPQAQLYSYPQAQQPYYQAPIQTLPVSHVDYAAPVQQPVAQAQPQAPEACPVCEPAPAVPAPQVEAPQAPVQQVNINQAPVVAPAPVVTEEAPVEEAPKAVEEAPVAETQTVDVKEPVEAEPQVDLNGFLAKLADPDFEVQANAMEEIANMVKEEPQKATELLDAKVFDNLINILNADSSKLAGPTSEQIAARQKLMSGEQISDEDKNLATTITPMEQAERNKSYAMFTSAILQKLYADEVNKLTGSNVPMTELPAAVQIVEQLKDNPNPMVRTSAIEALSYIQKPEYKQDLTTLFNIAKNDQDKNVAEAANAALEKLNQL